MSKAIGVSMLVVSITMGLAAAPAPKTGSDIQYVNIVVPNPNFYRPTLNYQYTHVAGLNSRDEVLTESPADNYPSGSCESFESTFCAAALWSEQKGYQGIPPQYYSDYVLNDKGVVGGIRPRAGAAGGAIFLWTQQEGFREIGYTGFSYCGGYGGFGLVLNNRGEITGRDCMHFPGGFFTSEKTGTVYIKAGTNYAYPSALNDKGEVAGSSTLGAFYWTEKDGFVNIQTRIGAVSAGASDINKQGLVLGNMTNSAGVEFFYLWDPKHGLQNTIPRPSSSCTVRLTSSGDLIGTCGSPGTQTRLWTWTAKSGMRDLATLGYDAVMRDFNDDGMVVGEYRTSPGAPLHAFVWSPSGGSIDLHASNPARTSVAKFINNNGVIAGEFVNYTGISYTSTAVACIWKPVK